MGYHVAIAEEAEADIREAFLWYEDQKNELGDLFQDYIFKAVKSVRINPLKYQVRYDDVRICFLKKFPYGVHFTVTEDEILIIAVFHTSLDPQKRYKR
ncbi:type II toxin-antitoxin system RelE/ParE family toxin [Salibacter halophilus]|uniref:Type II toxin-antitoxin system RelE/ParE family toxin n=1 Tax=Salibacter halophilus TaxID=1803916 RepID=A0A6N6M6B7_9FLAO|nr:type II toxin-antitoxin system RelE/ParE family toxin [Salibacter halophilus]KAB1063488.1 type II toxin-antitoxin system RelE/ParE family toxin [Salibacter halophilus]